MKTLFRICSIVLFFGLSFLLDCAYPAGEIPLYKDAGRTVDERVADLLSRMTLEEKILQLNQYILGENSNVNNIGEVSDTFIPGIGSYIYFNDNAVLRNSLQRRELEVSRLGIPLLFGFDVIHGFRTIFPIPLAQACSWNPELVGQACAVAAQEARMSGVEWVFSPMIDVARDGRWGRVAEGYGEDPYATSVFAVAAVGGYQGSDLSSPRSVAACLKHFVGYGLSQGGRDYEATDVSPQALWDTYLPPYEAGVCAGAATVMSAFNDINGTPAAANHYLLTEVLKEKWDFGGFVVADWNAVEQLISQGVAADKKEAAYKAFAAGVDMDMKDFCYKDHLGALVAEGKIPVARIDEAVANILALKFRWGLFEQPYAVELPEDERILLPYNKELATKMAEESMVLLKNDNGLLPLCAKTVAVIGPMADNREHMLGSWTAHGRVEDVEGSIYDNLQKEFGKKMDFLYAAGCGFDGDDRSGFAEARAIAEQADVLILCLGEKNTWSGENASRSTLALPAIQEALLQDVKKVGKPIVLVLFNGRPLELCRIEPLCDAIVEVWQPGIMGGKALAGILSGRINPSGKLSITFPLTTGQVPIYYNTRQSARPFQGKYQDIPTEPLYAFGHGLSYTTFEYGDLYLPKDTIRKNEKLRLEIQVTNAGNFDGKETVHWFVSDPTCSISRPVKELKFFEKQFIEAGTCRTFYFELIPERDLSFVNAQGERFLETGTYYVMVKDKKIKLELIDRCATP